MQTSPVSQVQPVSPTSGKTNHDKPPTRMGDDFSRARNIPWKTRLYAALGNEKSKIALAGLRGDVAKLDALYKKAALKFDRASKKLDRKKADLATARKDEKALSGYSRSPALSYNAQKYQNNNAALHEEARDVLWIADRKVTDAKTAVAEYSGRMALALEHLRNLGNREASVG